MEGSVRQRGPASWELRVYAGIDPETRKRHYRTATVHGNRADAERGLERLLVEVGAAKSIGSASTVSELLEAWFAIASLSWAPTTIRQTRSVLDRYLHPQLGGQRVGDVTPALVDATYATLRGRGGVHGKPLGAGSLARVHVVLRSAFAQAQRWGWVWDNPVERAHRIVVPPREMRPPTPAELQTLLQHIAAVDAMFHGFVLLAAISGARRSQLLALRWEDVSHSAMRVSFRSGWVEGPDGPTLATTKTKRAHSVDLDPHTYETLVSLASGQRQCGFVFSDDGGVTAWKPNRVTKTFVRYRRAVGLREFRLHDMRHFMATEMLDAGVPLPVVSRRLDHQRASTTLNVYAHAVPGRDAPAAQLLHRIIHNPATHESAERAGAGEIGAYPTAVESRNESPSPVPRS
jgi:integrase